MAMTEIGQATITIIPNMKGSQATISKELGATGNKSGNDAGDSFAKTLLKKVKQAGIGIAVGKFISDSLNAGAKIQQSFGGLETLYGDAADYAKEYAYQAAQAGISANDYAEQAVSFGASLKKAFGGDTKKAVEAANTAIMDMTDNAAKMGTPIESIQNAYQGFAKGQYNMLDNLKLGYGGTKTEMERLLADAQKISGVEYNIDNLGDVYDAIHVIQEDLGLTGVAAEEAATTFSGSFGAMKAAAENLMADLALGNDIGASLEALSGSVKTFVVGNLFPMIGNLVTQIPSVIAALPGFVADILPDLIAGVVDMVGQLAQAIVENGPTFIAGIRELLTQIPEAFAGIDWAGVANTMLEGLSFAVGGIWDSITSLLSVTFDIELPNWETVQQDIADLWKQVKSGIADFFKAAFDIVMDDDMTIIEKIGALWELVKSGISSYWKAVFSVTLPAFESVVSAISNWWGTNVWPAIQDFFKATFGIELPNWDTIIEPIKQGWEQIKAGISGLFETVFSVGMPSVDDVIAAIDTLRSGIWNGITGFFNVVFGLSIPTWSDVKESISTFWESIKTGIADWFKATFNIELPSPQDIIDGISALWNSIVAGIGGFFKVLFNIELPSWEDIKEAVSGLWNDFKAGISGFFKTKFKITMPSWSDVTSSIETGWNTVKSKIGGFFSKIFSIKLPDLNGIIEGIKTFWGKVTEGIGDFLTLKWVLGTPETKEMSKTLGQQIAEERKKYEGGTYEVKGDQVNIDSKAIQDALSKANLTLGDIDTGSLDTALMSVTTCLQAIKSEFTNLALALPAIGTQTLGTARALVTGTVAAIKSTMNFYWSLPTLHGHLPVISVNMQTATSSDGKTSVSYPSLSVSSYRWFAEGGVFNRPTVIGIGDSKGPEAAVPLDMMWNRMAKEFDKHLGGGATMTNYITVDGAQRPEEYADRLVRQLKLDLRTA